MALTAFSGNKGFERWLPMVVGGAIAAYAIKRPPVSRSPQPRPGPFRNPLHRPHAGGRHERVLQAVLGHVEAPQPRDEQGEQA